MNGSKKKRGQVGLEYLANYMWAFTIVVIVIGTMIYFDFFDTSKYTAQYCNFDANFFCTDYLIQELELSNFNIDILLQNSMDTDIIISKVNLYNDENVEVTCTFLNISCPFSGASYGTARPSNSKVSINTSNYWNPTRICRLSLQNCSSLRYESAKHKFFYNITFNGFDSTNNHTSVGVVNAVIEAYAKPAGPLTCLTGNDCTSYNLACVEGICKNCTNLMNGYWCSNDTNPWNNPTQCCRQDSCLNRSLLPPGFCNAPP